VSGRTVERHGKRWRVRWREEGRLHRRTFASETGAERFATQIDAEKERVAEERAAKRRAVLTVANIVHDYYERRKRRLEASTIHHYDQVIAKHVVPKIGPRSAREVADEPSILQDFYDSLPRTTAMHVHDILHPAFQHAVDHRRLERNPAEIAKPIRPRRKEKRIPTPAEVQKIVAAAFEKDRLFGLWVWLVSRLGLRRGEACALRWEDFDFDHCLVHIRRAIARRRGGTYIKYPKSGEARTVRMSKRFIEKLEPFRQPSGWLFPRGYNCPYRSGDGIAPQSTAGRLLVLLQVQGGRITCPEGRAGTEVARLLGLGRYSAGPLLRRMDAEGFIERVSTGNRTFAIAITEKGRLAGQDATDDGLPMFPTTANIKFRAIARMLDLPYQPHSLRHFAATHLYNRIRDWVQLARFLGHTNPAVTMSLYANHVVEASQLELGEAAMDLFDDHILDGEDAL